MTKEPVTPSEEPEVDPYVLGYREGYVTGYAEGTSDGRYQGYADAKWRAYKAVENDPDAERAVREFVGEL